MYKARGRGKQVTDYNIVEGWDNPLASTTPVIRIICTKPEQRMPPHPTESTFSYKVLIYKHIRQDYIFNLYIQQIKNVTTLIKIFFKCIPNLYVHFFCLSQKIQIDLTE